MELETGHINDATTSLMKCSKGPSAKNWFKTLLSGLRHMACIHRLSSALLEALWWLLSTGIMESSLLGLLAEASVSWTVSLAI
jgi:hypothetical protein